MQKLMQFFGNEVKNENLKTILDKLKDEIEPMTPEELQLVTDRAFGGYRKMTAGYLPWPARRLSSRATRNEPVHAELISLDQRVGSASIGEGWLGKVRFQGNTEPEQVFLKLMRWKVVERMERELNFLLGIKDVSPLITSVIDELVADLREELDWDLEVSNQLRAYRAFDSENQGGYDGLFVPKPMGLFRHGGASVILMPFMPGTTLKKILAPGGLSDKYACHVVNLQITFMRRWIEYLIKCRLKDCVVVVVL